MKQYGCSSKPLLADFGDNLGLRITLCIPTLGAGGAERAVCILAEAFQRNGHVVSVVTWSDLYQDFYPLPEGVSRVHWSGQGAGSGLWHYLRRQIGRLRGIRSAIKSTRPDVAISFLDGGNELFLLATVGMNFPKLVSCQNDLRMFPHKGFLWPRLQRYSYRMAHRVVFLDQEQSAWAERSFPGWRCEGIPNPLADLDVQCDEESLRVLEMLRSFPKRLAAMGRLTRQKGFDLLLKAFEPLARDSPEWGLLILGEGELRADLEQQSHRLGIQDRVLMPGCVHKPHSVLSVCDLFVFPSRFEGQGLALAEALACGLPAVSFDCLSGPALMIRHERNGLLVPPEDVNALSAALDRLMRDEEARTRMGRNALEIKNLFEKGSISMQWERLFRCWPERL